MGYVNKGTTLPIITEYDDNSVNGWACVSLRGAAGWIRKTPADTVHETFFRPEMLSEITAAMLIFGEHTAFVNAPADIQTLSALLVNAEDLGGEMAGCPFTATLTVYLRDGSEIELRLATDSCCVYRVDGRDYQYARHLVSGDEGSPENAVLFSLFGVNTQDEWADEWDGYSGNG